MLKSLIAGLFAFLATVFGIHQANTPTPVQHQAAAQTAAVVSAIIPSALPASGYSAPTAVASAPTNPSVSWPLNQQVAGAFDSRAALADLASSTAAMGAELQMQISALASAASLASGYEAAASLPLGGGAPNTIAAGNAIDQLSGVTITNANLTASEIPALAYLSSTGGTVSGLSEFTNASTSLLSVSGPAYFGTSAISTFGTDGSLILNGSLTANGNTTLTNATSTTLYAESATIPSLTGTWAMFTNATSTNFHASNLTLDSALALASGGTGATTAANARTNLGAINVCNVVTDEGADPTGVVDASTAINNCASVTRNGQLVNIYLPAGTYYLANPVTLTAGETLYGDGYGNTTITVDRGFSSSATGVIILNGAMVDGQAATQAPSVHDLTISFAQPSDQGTRANFAVLGSCTSGTGGTGCEYPPAIYEPSTASGRVQIYNVQLLRAWDGIDLQRAGGVYISNIRESSLNAGLIMANGFDFGTVSHWEHQAFGVSGNLYTGVYEDGNDYAMQLGETDGDTFEDIHTWEGRIALTSAFTWGTFDDLELDGNDSTLEVTATAGTGGLIIDGGYSSGAATGADTHCQIDIASGNASTVISNFAFTAGGPGAGGLCVAGGTVQVDGGSFNGNGVTVVNLTGGHTSIVGATFESPDRTFGSDQIVVGASAHVVLEGNTQVNAATQGEAFGTFSSDFSDNAITNNILNGWTFTAPGTNGMYDLNTTTSGAVSFSNNVGIGTTSPATTLSVSGNGYITGAIGIGVVNPTAGSVAINRISGAPNVSLEEGAVGLAQLRADSSLGIVGLTSANGGSYYLSVNYSTGNVGIGTTTPSARLTVWGSNTASTTAFNVVNSASTTVFAVYDSGNSTYSGSIFQSSDERLKTDVQSLDASSSLSLLQELNPVSYLRIDQPGGGENLGFLAQQVGGVFPELVSTTSPTALTPDGTLTLNYTGLIAPIISAIQALSTELTSLENTVAGFAASFSTRQLCIVDDNGSTCITRAQLVALLANQGDDGSSGQGSGASGDQATSSPETPPVIQINGDNPAYVTVGATYNDLGATITGPQADLNLGISTFVNGSPMSPIVIDTSVSATDTIDYVATDQYGLTSTTTRTLIIQAPASSDASSSSQ